MHIPRRADPFDRRAVLIGAGTCLLATDGAVARAFGASIHDLRSVERSRVTRAADRALAAPIRTITSVRAARSPGGLHDYYSEADYWWPDPVNPGKSYVRRDGFSNPAKFDAHRQLLIAFGMRMPALAAAWVATRKPVYPRAAAAHLHAWFVDPATRMNPDLSHAQAIIGRDTGRAIGIIDTLQIVEVARGAAMLGRAAAPGFDERLMTGVRAWFVAYVAWLTTSPAGIEERDQANNHGTCWLLQVAAFADLLGDMACTSAARDRLIGIVVPRQIAADGSQPLELARTKPYGYSLFNTDVLAACCQLLSTPERDVWRATTPPAGSVADAVAYMARFVRDKHAWPLPPDVEHFASWPVRQPSLLFAGVALDRPEWVSLWRGLDGDPTDPEVVRNFPVRQPLLWLPGSTRIG